MIFLRFRSGSIAFVAFRSRRFCRETGAVLRNGPEAISRRSAAFGAKRRFSQLRPKGKKETFRVEGDFGHSITSSARARSTSGTLSPSAPGCGIRLLPLSGAAIRLKRCLPRRASPNGVAFFVRQPLKRLFEIFRRRGHANGRKAQAFCGRVKQLVRLWMDGIGGHQHSNTLC